MTVFSTNVSRAVRERQVYHVLKFYRALWLRNVYGTIAHQTGRRAPVSRTLRGRNSFGAFRTQIEHLLTTGTDDDLKQLTGLTFGELNLLYNGIKDEIAPKKRSDKYALSAKEKLFMTLSFLRGGWTIAFSTTSWLVSRWTMSKVLKQVCPVISDYVKMNMDFTPNTEQEWFHVAEEFEKRWNLPHCLGSVDGKHVKIRKFDRSGSVTINYKKFPSIVLMAVVDSHYRILHFNVGSPGIRSDGGIFREDRLGQALRKGEVDLPQPRQLSKDGNNVHGPFPYYFIGDAAFGVSPYMLCPYPGEELSEEEEHFNYRLSRARMIVECVFGHLASRFGVLQCLTVGEELAIELVRSCCYLHNYLRWFRSDDQQELDTIRKRGRKLLFEEPSEPPQNSGKELRDILATYLNTMDKLKRKKC